MQVLNFDGIYKLEIAKFIAKISSNSLPVFSRDHIVNFPKDSQSMHTQPVVLALKDSLCKELRMLKQNNHLKYLA